MKLETSEWKPFRLNELFELRGGYYNKKPEHSADGTIPFLGSTENNNGVTEYYSIQDIEQWDKVGNEDWSLKNKLYDGNCIAITVDGSVCNAYYQRDRFTCSHSVTALYLKIYTLNESIALFLCAIIMREKYRWSYGRKPHDIKKLGNMTIKLPATSDGTPDWDFMESYMKTLHYKPLTTKNKPGKAPELETEKWGNYLLDDFFNIVPGKYHYPSEYDRGTTPYYSASNTNNGISQYISLDPDFEGNCIITGKIGSTAFYAPTPFCATSDVNVFIPKFQMSPFVGLFISGVINFSENYKWAYGRQCRVGNSKKIYIKLPSTPDGTPDWQFMEDYIKALPYGDRL